MEIATLASGMRTLLRHTDTGLYLQGPDRWTASPFSAYDFRFLDRARHFVLVWELERVEVAFAFEDSSFVSTRSLEVEVEVKDAA
jgi:hypothetical protein